jgi:hypothetical protein
MRLCEYIRHHSRKLLTAFDNLNEEDRIAFLRPLAHRGTAEHVTRLPFAKRPCLDPCAVLPPGPRSEAPRLVASGALFYAGRRPIG